MLFSHEDVRPTQGKLVAAVADSLKKKKHILIHAPTGLGKTAGVLCPALELAMERDLTVFFLTSRHTQHKIVLETVQKLNKKHNLNVVCASLIGKKWLCAQDNTQTMASADFAEFCKSLVEGDECEFYRNARGKNNLIGKRLVESLHKEGPLAAEQVMIRATNERVCPYEASLMLAETAKVIVADYYYIFHPNIRDSLFGKLKKKLEQCIIIVDEGHNLPGRLRELLTTKLSNRVMRLAIQEAKKFDVDVIASLVEIQDVLNKLSVGVQRDKLVRKEDFLVPLEKFKSYEELIAELDLAGEMIRSEQKRSHIGAIVKFLQDWRSGRDGFARIIKREGELVTLTNSCLEPALLTKEVFDSCYSAIIMSGTLNPTSMYADILGIPNALQCSFESPFPEVNKLSLIIPKTTTKYAMRNERMYENIGLHCADIANRIPGGVMIFFPSYNVRDSVEKYFSDEYEKTAFFETPGMDKAAKQRLLDKFTKEAKESGAALLGVAAGSFGEGIDLPGVLKGVIVAGLPLDKPDLETSELIAYYDKLFGKGWEYAYTIPAMTKSIQNAGRCIRSEKDRGAIIFLDVRYAWPRYRSCFPSEWNLIVTESYQDELGPFFGRLF
ncbi:hypothetical protein COV18_02525 [Candidatus Woesearchaeota archaeon CG10_big_fil_rev_8_21_14_0_10_37_12]|nr:MAG: hypothetical protein COV18_02525 [Candidatus Woesearchaeota archaeon CG10_big_fil_rev_8_21_14_0_10_37_12]